MKQKVFSDMFSETKFKLEIIAFNIESCVTIEKSGAHRIELCDNPEEGGTTPSFGLIKQAREKVDIDLFPIIRPRGGDFLYTDNEFQVMKDDVQVCKDMGCDGVVVGLLCKNGTIDIKRTEELRKLAYPLKMTFHRAFDQCIEPFKALEQLIEIGCDRILTSGQKNSAFEGSDLIAQLVRAADNKIIVMPGSSVRKENIKELAIKTRASEFHSSLRSVASSKMSFLPPDFIKQSKYPTVKGSDIRALILELNNLNNSD